MGVQHQNNITKKSMKKNRTKELIKNDWMKRMKVKKYRGRDWMRVHFYRIWSQNNEEGC